jgi:hypothetical protein
MTRLLLKPVDLGGSAVFATLCVKALFFRLYSDTTQRMSEQGKRKITQLPPAQSVRSKR